MTVRVEKTVVVLDGVCPPEEAETLQAALVGRKRRRVDLSACAGLHTAVLQVLLASGADIVAPPANPLLARWLMPASRPRKNNT